MVGIVCGSAKEIYRGYRMCHITIDYTERIDENKSGVLRVIAPVKPLNNEMETMFAKDNTELKRLSKLIKRALFSSLQL